MTDYIYYGSLWDMYNFNRKDNMQTKNKTIADEMFEHANIINDASRTANLYGKLFALQEMQIYVLSEIKKVKDQIERKDTNE